MVWDISLCLQQQSIFVPKSAICAVYRRFRGDEVSTQFAAMLIAFLGVLAFINAVLAWMGGFIGLPMLSLEGIFGVIFAKDDPD